MSLPTRSIDTKTVLAATLVIIGVSAAAFAQPGEGRNAPNKVPDIRLKPEQLKLSCQ